MSLTVLKSGLRWGLRLITSITLSRIEQAIIMQRDSSYSKVVAFFFSGMTSTMRFDCPGVFCLNVSTCARVGNGRIT